MKPLISEATSLRVFAFTGGILLGGAAHENVFEELAGSATRAPVDVARETFLQLEAGSLKDVGIEALRVVHDDDHRGPIR